VSPDGPRIRLLALDLDGTLVHGESGIRSLTHRALLRAHRSGVAIAIATGRRYRRTRGVAERLGLPVPVVCLGGALVKEGSGRTVHADAFAPDDFRAVAECVRLHGQTAVAQLEADDGEPDFAIDGSVAWNGFSRRYWERNREHAVWSRRLADERRDDVLVVGTFGPLAELETLAAAIERAWPGRYAVVVTPLPPGTSGPGGHYCEVVPACVSKWSGLRQLARHAGIPDDAICAVGDERNDLAMIRGAALGVAMGNAPPEVRAAADFVTGRFDEDGLVTVVERILAS
jgi:Cof subfamily protein (haloacid dehalogenase superfamily)